jgi:hypothetical protein
MVDKATANPVAPMQRGIPKWRTEHITAGNADANPSIGELPLLQFVAQLRQKHRDVLAEQIPPRLMIELVAKDVDAVAIPEIRTHGFIETELIAVVGRPRLRTEAEKEAVEAR